MREFPRSGGRALGLLLLAIVALGQYLEWTVFESNHRYYSLVAVFSPFLLIVGLLMVCMPRLLDDLRELSERASTWRRLPSVFKAGLVFAIVTVGVQLAFFNGWLPDTFGLPNSIR